MIFFVFVGFMGYAYADDFNPDILPIHLEAEDIVLRTVFDWTSSNMILFGAKLEDGAETLVLISSDGKKIKQLDLASLDNYFPIIHAQIDPSDDNIVHFLKNNKLYRYLLDKDNITELNTDENKVEFFDYYTYSEDNPSKHMIAYSVKDINNPKQLQLFSMHDSHDEESKPMVSELMSNLESDEFQLSPDGTKILFQKTLDASYGYADRRIAYLEAQDYGPHLVSDLNIRCGNYPKWYPSGELIVYHVSYCGRGAPGGVLGTISLDGNNSQILLPDNNDNPQSFAINQNGSTIVILPSTNGKSYGDIADFYLLNLLGVSERKTIFPRHGNPPDSFTPLQHERNGTPFDQMQCRNDDFVLVQKYDGSPACVKPKSINSLIFRGWADEKFRTLPIIDFQNPDRIFREVGYLGLMMFLPHIEENQTIAISLEGKSNMVLPIIQRYDVEILSEKTNTDKSFSSIFGKITKPNLQKFFEENPMNIFVKRGVLLTSLGGYQDNTGTYGPFNQFLTDNESQIAGDILTYYENKRTNGEDVHFSDFVKWPTGKINESFLQKSKLLDIAEIEENRIALNPTDTCAHISLRLLSADKLAQYHTRDKEIQFFEITDTDLKELPVLDELIRATHHLEFTTNEDAHAEISLRELVDYEFFIMEKAIGKYDDSQDDYFVKLDGNLDEKLADPKPQGFSNEFLSPQLVYDDNVYVLSHTVFWVANEHETQSISVHLRNSIDNDKKFITLTEKDMESIPKIKQAIEKIGTEFESIVAYKGLPENPDWNEYREWFGQKKTEQFNLDETYVPGFVYNDEYYDLGFPIC
ncbi:hypothetical protein [Nitrosopumilus zosterae]|nr:hypothetical protein [Nitrosopumilus zosterae]BDQ30517.1 hypothetical protein NZOSNM25_000621 [Nitrosopumilus zosterae]